MMERVNAAKEAAESRAAELEALLRHQERATASMRWD